MSYVMTGLGVTGMTRTVMVPQTQSARQQAVDSGFYHAPTGGSSSSGGGFSRTTLQLDTGGNQASPDPLADACKAANGIFDPATRQCSVTVDPSNPCASVPGSVLDPVTGLCKLPGSGGGGGGTPTISQADCLTQKGTWDPSTSLCTLPSGGAPAPASKMWLYLLGGAAVIGLGLFAMKKSSKKLTANARRRVKGMKVCCRYGLCTKATTHLSGLCTTHRKATKWLHGEPRLKK